MVSFSFITYDSSLFLPSSLAEKLLMDLLSHRHVCVCVCVCVCVSQSSHTAVGWYFWYMEYMSTLREACKVINTVIIWLAFRIHCLKLSFCFEFFSAPPSILCKIVSWLILKVSAILARLAIASIGWIVSIY